MGVLGKEVMLIYNKELSSSNYNSYETERCF